MQNRLLIKILVPAVIAAGSVVAAVNAAGAETTPDARLAEILDGVLGDPRLEGAQSTVQVRDAATGETVYDHGGDHAGIPASTMKLLTSAAAMDILGPEHRFVTDVRTDGSLRHGVLDGDLYLRGTGDPTMIDADYDDLARQLAEAGVTAVTGDLVADDTWFDSRRLGLEWAWDDEPYQFAAQVSALNLSAFDTDYNTGTVFIEVIPGAEGTTPRVRIDPPSKYVKVSNTAKTVAADGEYDVWIERRHGSNVIDVSGTIPVGAEPAADLASVWEPTGLVAEIFRTAMKKHGITVLGGTRTGRATPENAEVLAARKSMPLSEMLVPFMKYSLNSHGEVLVKTIGRAVSGEGTWDAGLSAIGDYLTAKGLDDGKYVIGDGSGMTRRTYVPTAEILDLLVAVRSEPWFATWEAALPVAGDPDPLVGGTLRSRMRGTPAAGNVHAKTGSMTGVSTLSGYVTDADGRALVFGVQLNHLVTQESVRPIEDMIAVALASYSRTAPPETMLAPSLPEPGPEQPVGLECSWVTPKVC
ncbi:D-alanyl-D-alanine carboxypeptidase/D-alanyl-D-alanine-endopeptidase [Phytomonospora sp. NPDC050363]|uniref:D-alanyl-D-alanine carboxypeptidase/D-alanyl-D-alanine endopeptidase n=1 Tax=Phytomonospora sp. NPDC050363 TaxID=3155642 RepID=UPI00340A9589